jgi:hypothetical protein
MLVLKEQSFLPRFKNSEEKKEYVLSVLVMCFVLVSVEFLIHASLALHSFSQFEWGWDASPCEFCNLMERGVIDPAKVTINAIENSASVAGLVLTTECLVTEIPIVMTDEMKQQMFDQSNMAAGMGP